MEIIEIFKDALVYPINNVKSLILYLVLGIILGIALTGTIAGLGVSVANNNLLGVIGIGVLGIVISLILSFVISGYELDIIKYGIEKSDDAPEIDFLRQFVNGVKLFVVNIVYFFIPIVIGAILGAVSNHWVIGLVSLILYIVFAFAAFMGQCRLAKTEDLGYSLSILDAFGDIAEVGFVNLLLFIVIAAVIIVVLSFIVGFITGWNSTIGGILLGILGIYLVFVIGRASGLLYSNV